MGNFALRKPVRPLLALATGVTLSAIAPTASAYGYGAISGTTADKIFSNFQHLNMGGVTNASTNARDWLIPINTYREACTNSDPCTLKATFKGGTGGSSCVRAYRLNNFGQVVATVPSGSPICQGSALATKTIGSIGGTASTNTLLVVANLAGGSGAIASVELSGHVTVGNSTNVGAIRGVGEGFSTGVSWTEWGTGGIRNRAAIDREWWIDVPGPSGTSTSTQAPAGAVFGGGFGGQSCVNAYGLNASGAILSSPPTSCGTSVTQANFGNLLGTHTMYIASLARASTAGAADGGFIATVRY